MSNRDLSSAMPTSDLTLFVQILSVLSDVAARPVLGSRDGLAGPQREDNTMVRLHFDSN